MNVNPRMKLTRAGREKIARDWKARFPEFCLYEPMHLLKRCGPLLIGILLERSSSNDDYLPIVHIHNLAEAREGISLTAATELRTPRTNAPDWIKVRDHDRRFENVADRLEQQAPLPLEGAITLQQVLGLYDRHLRSARFPTEEYGDTVTLPAVLGEGELALQRLDVAVAAIRSWPPEILEDIGGLDAWKERYESLISNPGVLKKIVADSVESLGLDRVPSVPMVS